MNKVGRWLDGKVGLHSLESKKELGISHTSDLKSGFFLLIAVRRGITASSLSAVCLHHHCLADSHTTNYAFLNLVIIRFYRCVEIIDRRCFHQ